MCPPPSRRSSRTVVCCRTLTPTARRARVTTGARRWVLTWTSPGKSAARATSSAIAGFEPARFVGRQRYDFQASRLLPGHACAERRGAVFPGQPQRGRPSVLHRRPGQVRSAHQRTRARPRGRRAGIETAACRRVRRTARRSGRPTRMSPPPQIAPRSASATVRPSRAARIAIAVPTIPPPTTATSNARDSFGMVPALRATGPRCRLDARFATSADAQPTAFRPHHPLKGHASDDSRPADTHCTRRIACCARHGTPEDANGSGVSAPVKSWWAG